MHFAKVNNGIVEQVIAAEEEFFNGFVDDTPGEWVQTSYNTLGGIHYGQEGVPDEGIPIRKNFAGVGFIYDSVRDAFIPDQIFPSWTLNETSCLWEAPTAVPDDGEYSWNEETTSWVETEGSA